MVRRIWCAPTENRWRGYPGCHAAEKVEALQRRAWRLLQGEWLAFLDADDWWDPRKLARQLAELAKHRDPALNYTGVWVVDEVTGKRWAGQCFDANVVWPALHQDQRNLYIHGAGAAQRSQRGGRIQRGSRCLRGLGTIRTARARFSIHVVRRASGVLSHSSTSSSQNLSKHLETIPKVCEGAMVAGLTGLERWTVERRVGAAQLYGGALIGPGSDGGVAGVFAVRPVLGQLAIS